MANAKEQTEFDWLATESAPENYPMQIMRGSSFIYHGSEHDGLYIPSGGVLYRGWGSAISSHVVGPAVKPLPDKLDITFYSYLEDTFYRGMFDLPYEKILSLFREGVEQNKENPAYRYIMVGVAPGGTVAVWIKGAQSKIEIFFGSAKKIDLDLAEQFRVPVKDRAKYVNDIVVDSIKPEILAVIRKNGIPFDQWKKYGTQYRWLPTFVGGSQPITANVAYFNGEADKKTPVTHETKSAITHPAPTYFSFHSQIAGGTQKSLFIINFDEAEIFSAFAKLGSHQEQLYLEFSPTLPKPDTKIRLYNDKESIQLNKWKVDVW